MSKEMQLSLDPITGWCAGCKISNMSDHNVEDMEWSVIERMVADDEGSVAVVSVNEHETLTIAWLINNGFEQSSVYNNFNSGNKTQLFLKQVSQEVWNETNDDSYE
jgi:hypothetical protein